MNWGPEHPRWLLFAGEVVITGRELNEEHKANMAVQVQGLAEIVKQAKQAIDKAANMSTRVNASATNLVATVAAVEAMVGELDNANAQLQGALGTITNGGPPLETGAPVQPPPSPPSPAPEAAPVVVAPDPAAVVANGPNPADVTAAKTQVEIANAGAPAPLPPVAPAPVANASVQATADKYIQRIP